MIDEETLIFGLTQKQFKFILDAISQFEEIERALIFGSRARADFKSASDIDLAVIGKNITSTIITKLSAQLDELPLPFMFDVLDYNAISNIHLKNKIDLQGKIFFNRQSNSLQLL